MVVLDELWGSKPASTGLVLTGLDFDAGGETAHALSQYERAIQIDATNPYAYLALARYYADSSQPGRSLQYLEQAELLLVSQRIDSPQVEAHLVGLRGWALLNAGRFSEGAALLGRARRLAPDVWDDSRLSADELR